MKKKIGWTHWTFADKTRERNRPFLCVLERWVQTGPKLSVILKPLRGHLQFNNVDCDYFVVDGHLSSRQSCCSLWILGVKKCQVNWWYNQEGKLFFQVYLNTQYPFTWQQTTLQLCTKYSLSLTEQQRSCFLFFVFFFPESKSSSYCLFYENSVWGCGWHIAKRMSIFGNPPVC